MAKQDNRINLYGVDGADLREGQWVEISWRDAPNEIVLIIEAEVKPKTYKGDRSLTLFAKDSSNHWFIQHADHSQVVRIIPYELEYPKL